MKTNLHSILLILCIISSCTLKKYPTGTKEFEGTIKTCIIDSTSILNNSIITVVNGLDLNTSCPNRPNFNDLEMSRVWPVHIFFNFKDKEYWYMFSPDAKFEKNELKKVSFSSHDGNLVYNKKSKTIKMTCLKFNWEKTYIYHFNKKTKTLVLTEMKNDL